MAAPALTKAWSAFFAQAAVNDSDELRAAGWRTNAEIAAETKLSGTAGLQLADKGVRDGILEKKVFKVMIEGRRHNVNFYRPKNEKPGNSGQQPRKPLKISARIST